MKAFTFTCAAILLAVGCASSPDDVTVDDVDTSVAPQLAPSGGAGGETCVSRCGDLYEICRKLRPPSSRSQCDIPYWNCLIDC